MWKSAPAPWASAASSAMGWTVPTTLLAAITDTSRVVGRSAAASVSGSTRPSAVDRQIGHLDAAALEDPARLEHGRVLEGAHDRRGRAPAHSPTAPKIARLSASVPLPVKTISAGRAPISAATSARPASTRVVGLRGPAVQARGVAERSR